MKRTIKILLGISLIYFLSVSSVQAAFRFVVLADSRGNRADPGAAFSGSEDGVNTAALSRLIEMIGKEDPKPAFILFPGDLVEGERGQEFRVQIRKWKECIAPLNKNNIPIYISAGNHEIEKNKSAYNILFEEFDFPRNGPEGYLAYSFDYKDSHFIALDSYSPNYDEINRVTKKQLAWLKKDLARTTKENIFVFLHDPGFPVGSHIGWGLDAYPKERDVLWQELAKYKVKAVFTAHEHHYHRSRPDGVIQIIAGGAGGPLESGSPGAFYHYLIVDVDNKDIKVQVRDIDGRIRDNFSLINYEPPESEGPSGKVIGDLMLSLNFDEGEGPEVKDNSPNGNDGKIYGARWVMGISGSALQFDGVDDYVEVPGSASLNVTEAVTIEAWIYPTEPAMEFDRIVEKDYAQAYALVGVANRLRFEGRVGEAAQGFYSGGGAVTYDAWNHVAVTYDGSAGKFYVNGQLRGTSILDPPGNIGISTSTLRIGAYQPSPPSYAFTGIIDEVKVYNRALSEEELKSHFGEVREKEDFSGNLPSGRPSEDKEGVSSFADFYRSLSFNSTSPESFYFLQISDTHITTDRYPQDCVNFRRFIAEVETLEPKPAFVALTGDVVDSGKEAYWRKFHELVKEFEQRLPEVPLYIALGNHDDHADTYLNLFPERRLSYSFDRGGVRFIGLYPYPNKIGPTIEDDSASLGAEQIKWVQSLISSYQGKTLVMFLHQPPLSGDYVTNDLILDLQTALDKVASGTKVWMVSGHWHGNHVFRVSDLAAGKDVYTAITISIHSDNYENNVQYRLFFVQNGEIVKVATKSPDSPFRIEPAEDSWPQHYPFYSPDRPVLLFVNIPDDGPYLVREKGTKIKRAYRDLRSEGAELVYRVPAPPGTTHLGVYAIWQYLVEVSSNGRDWMEIANSEIREKSYQVRTDVPAEGYYKLAIPLPADLVANKTLYIRFRDPVPNSEHAMEVEAAIEWFSLLGSE